MLPLVAWGQENPITLNASDGNITITETGYSIDGAAETSYIGDYVITQGNVSTAVDNPILVKTGTHTITLNGVNIKGRNESGNRTAAFTIEPNAKVSLILNAESENILAGAILHAGLEVPQGAEVVISGTGALTTSGGQSSAGIGGGYGMSAGTITINAGTIKATGDDGQNGASGIGSGYPTSEGNNGIITINGGSVETTGYGGIGISRSGYDSNIIIAGGTVVATGDRDAGIGANESITIHGGNVTAIGGGSSGAGIEGNNGTITISGGTVSAKCGEVELLNMTAPKAGISIGQYGIVKIEDGDVTAIGGENSAGIGGSYNGVYGICGTIEISGGKVKATGGSSGPGIGGSSLRNWNRDKVEGNGTILISGGEVIAESGGNAGGAAIGAGEGIDGIGGIIRITGGQVTAIGHTGAAIGGGAVSYVDNATSNNNIIICGGTVLATSGEGAGIGYGKSGDAQITFSTTCSSTSGNAYIVASSIEVDTDENDWSGVIFNGNNGQLYGSNSYTLTQDATIPKNHILTIKEGQTLSVESDVTLANKGTIINEGTIEGPIDNEDGATIKSIIKKEDIKVSVEKKEYDGEAPEVTVTVDGDESSEKFTVSYIYSKIEDGHETELEEAPTDAGSYKVTVTVKGTGKADDQGYAYTETEVKLDVEFAIDQASVELKFEQEAVEKLTTDGTFTNPITGVPADVTITYSSSDEAIATVNGQGEVTILKAGEVTISASINNTNYIPNKASYTLKIQEPEPDPETPVIPDMPKYYNIMVEECEGVTVETSSDVVREGQSMAFTIDVAEGYTVENMTVKVKRSLFGYTEVIEPNNEGIYEIKNIYTDIYITVDGVEEVTPTGMEDVESAKVYTKDGSIYVQTPQQEQVQIISISGAVLKSETQVGLQRYDLPRGIYIIGIGEERYKVRN